MVARRRHADGTGRAHLRIRSTMNNPVLLPTRPHFSLRPGSRRTVRGLLLLAFLGIISGCSTFERDWRAMAGRRAVDALPVGRWQGHWSSESNGHRGKLRCLVDSAGSNRFSARFRAIYAGFIPYEHTIVLTGVDRNGLWRFEGEEDLGWLAGGVYRFDGEASPDRFFTRYTSASERGVFELRRTR
jgi:hypothetical protein